MTEFDHRYIIGIDLGTTNSAVSYVDLREEEGGVARRRIRTFPVPQLVGLGEVAARRVLPSFLYLPGPHELPAAAADLPWAAGRDYVVGEFAREQGARTPGRLVASAKSWLSHAGVDRTAAILPWGAGEEVAKVSPVEASARYLQHIREAWDATMADPDAGDGDDPDRGRFDEQLIVLTVPASFDEVARELTVEAARAAGLERAILLEEPLAAFYAWLSSHERDWRNIMRDGQLILVCDVGGGTTDFSILGIREGTTGLRFDRLAVGDHLMLGGDNMDLTLARLVETKLMGRPGKLDAARWHQLVHQCRQAKEQLLGARGELDAVPITIMGTGGSLIGGTLASSLDQREIEQIILDGFFPPTPADAEPESARRSGLSELGLPYVHDPAVTRHLAAFWRRFADYLAQETGRDAPWPDYILFNGGALTPAVLRERISGVVAEWFRPLAGPDWRPSELHNPRPEIAVSTGAAYYGLVRLGMGVRVGSGSPRAYYVAVETGETGETPAEELSGGEACMAVCLVPRGAEEGYEIQLDDLDFTALTNRPVAFEVFTTSTRLGDKAGDLVALTPDEISVLPPIRTVLRYGKKGEARRIPVRLSVRLTEIGVLEVWCNSLQSGHRWQLQFDVRQTPGGEQSEPAVAEILDEAVVAQAQQLIIETFGPDATRPPAQLRRALESLLDADKEHWPTSLIRKLADELLENAHGRRRSPDHEAAWLNLLGFCLRPGFGDPVDDWRMKRVWKLFFEGLRFPRQTGCRTQWWIFWRRVAGGLKAGQQLEVYNQVRGYVNVDAKRKKKPGGALPKTIGPGETMEVWLMLANFERLTADLKVNLGRRLLKRMGKDPAARELWALSRLGARNPIYGPLERVIPAAEAGQWAERLLALPSPPRERMAHALVLLVQYTGDRTRDVDEPVRARVEAWLAQLDNADRFRDLLLNPDSAFRREEQAWIFGEALPAGLALASG